MRLFTRLFMFLLVVSCCGNGILAQTPPASPTTSVTGPLAACAPIIAVSGAVKTPLTLEAGVLDSLPWSVERVKWSGPDGQYRGSFAAEGVPLHALLGKAELTKKTDDGFNRELDMYVLVTGMDGSTAVFSQGEVFLGALGGGVHLQRRWRYLFPHKHSDVAGSGFDVAAWLPTGADRLETLKKGNCLGCHAGERPPQLHIPGGMAVVGLDDQWGGRFVEDVKTIEVRQAPALVPDPKPANKDEMLVEEPVLVLPDGASLPINVAMLATMQRQQGIDCSFGLGRGFHGIHQRDGFPLRDLLTPHLGKADPKKLCVLVTAADGYRSLFSGGEVFLHPNPANVMLVENVDGKPLGPGQGKYKVYAASDFYVDRCIRTVKEIRLFVP